MGRERGEIVLFTGADGNPKTGDGWMPAITLEHYGGHEMGVNVGEEAGGMVEGISVETFEAMRSALSSESNPEGER